MNRNDALDTSIFFALALILISLPFSIHAQVVTSSTTAAVPNTSTDTSQTYSTAGTYTFVAPSHADVITVEVWGAGGGGQQCHATAVSQPYPLLTCLGGGTGGTSYFSNVTAVGGHGAGTYSNISADLQPPPNATGGPAQGGDINIQGEAGNWNIVANPGKGGGSPNGGGRSGGFPGGGGDGIFDNTWGSYGGGGGGYAKKTYATGQLMPGSQISVAVGSGGAYGGATGAVKITWTIATPVAVATTTNPAPMSINTFNSVTKYGGTLMAGTIFNNALSPDPISDLQVYIVAVSTGQKIAGIATKYADGVSYETSAPVTAGADYQLLVKSTITDVYGSHLSTDYVSPIFRADPLKFPTATTTSATTTLANPSPEPTTHVTYTTTTPPDVITPPHSTTTPPVPILNTPTTTPVIDTSKTVVAPIFQGHILLNGQGTNASLWAWSDRGEKLNPAVDSDGSFSVRLTKGTIWHLGAGKEADGAGYKSTEITVDTSMPIVSQDLTLEKIARPLPRDVVVQQSSSNQVNLQTDNGASVVVPPNAVETGGGPITVAMNPTVEAPNQPAATVVGAAYDITAKDHLGNQVTSLASSAQITLPYDPQDLADLGITAGALMPSYFDENTQTWIKISTFTLDTVNHLVIIQVNHFTRFALVAAADITPPPSPSGVSGSFTGGMVRLAWVNPAKDFDHAKVYRSTEKGKLGAVKASEVNGRLFVDADVAKTTTYYYTVRAIDPAGNESSNADQVQVSTGVSASSKRLTTSLKMGARGSEVVLLQNALINERLLESDLNTGYFGKMTFAAVIKFQDKYAREVLAPAGLAKGSGFVGSFTRNKINALFY